MTQSLDLRPQVMDVGVGFGVRLSLTVTIAIGTVPICAAAVSRCKIGAQFDIGVAHAGVSDRLGEQQGQEAGWGARLAFWREPGSSSDLAAEPGE